MQNRIRIYLGFPGGPVDKTVGAVSIPGWGTKVPTYHVAHQNIYIYVCVCVCVLHTYMYIYIYTYC